MNEQLKYYKQKIVLKFKRSSQFFRMKVYRVKNKKFQIIMKNNRKFLKGVDTFLTTKQYSNGDYGIPIKLFEHIDKPFNNYPTQRLNGPHAVRTYKSSFIVSLSVFRKPYP